MVRPNIAPGDALDGESDAIAAVGEEEVDDLNGDDDDEDEDEDERSQGDEVD